MPRFRGEICIVCHDWPANFFGFAAKIYSLNDNHVKGMHADDSEAHASEMAENTTLAAACNCNNYNEEHYGRFGQSTVPL